VKTLTVALAVLVAVALMAGPAFAFGCPKLVAAANEAIAKAEPMAGSGDDRQKARNAGFVQEAKDLVKGAEADHASAKHGRSEAKAKAAKFLAEQVK
jgi:hypothetical protein